jgi:hypothetical protein
MINFFYEKEEKKEVDYFKSPLRLLFERREFIENEMKTKHNIILIEELVSLDEKIQLMLNKTSK